MARWVSRAIKFRFCPILQEAQNKSEPVDLQDVLLRLTFDNICGLAFGKDPQTCANSSPRTASLRLLTEPPKPPFNGLFCPRQILREISAVLIETRGIDTLTWLDEPLGFEELDRLIFEGCIVGNLEAIPVSAAGFKACDG
ncbi:hypothetical protein F3Y22_tig00010968pilonHSYRG00254 [Hibiscus syriacus]|uniref:Uncharacterized protein n=1 Tax=Hibiscus syriacus TaxID=106335 RepID=A0A6A3C9A7_HIBSY|nr:hypothetical protein F3Y22_tig00010968pilonHSYRG00254 [Hibiscus syriacus]